MVEYEHKRRELILILDHLRDTEYQKSAWVNFDVPSGVEDSFDEAVHFLFDDTELADNPEALLGVILEAPEEIPLVMNVTQAIQEILGKYGNDLTDEQYIAVPEWQGVVQAAATALAYMKH